MLKRLTKTIFKIHDFKCTFCTKLLEKFLSELPGIYRVRGSYSRKSLLIEYDSSIGDIALLIETIKEIGFTAVFKNNFSRTYVY